MGIVLAVGGAGLYFLRSFKPALARDYDVFFAAIGLLCGGILFFQGWRLDPILQFGQFLLAGTTVFFAYESVRLRGVATDQARRSSYFDEEPEDPTRMTGAGLRGGWDDSYDQFDQSQPLSRRFSPRNEQDSDSSGDDFYRPRRTSRAAIPEQAASRSIRNRSTEEGSWKDESDQERRMARFGTRDDDSIESNTSFGERRNLRQDQRRGSRPSASQQTSTRRRNSDDASRRTSSKGGGYSPSSRSGVSKGTRPLEKAEDASFSPSRDRSAPGSTPKESGTSGRRNSSRYSSNLESRRSSSNAKRRDNSSRFDD